MQHPVDEILAREVSAATLADVRTVRRVLRGEQVRGLVGARIRAELGRRRLIVAAPAAPEGQLPQSAGTARQEGSNRAR